MQTALRVSFIETFDSETKGPRACKSPPPMPSTVDGADSPAGGGTMRALFIDCNEQLAPVWRKVVRPDDPTIDVNVTPFAREELPRVVGPYEIVLDDHSYMPTE